jgi:hypothetical protein
VDVASERPRIVAACVAEPRRRRIEAALDGIASVRFHATFADLMGELDETDPVAAVIVDARDPAGQTLAQAGTGIGMLAPSASVLLYASHQEVVRGAIASPAITDVILADEVDSRPFLQRVVLGAVLRRSADRVVRALRGRLTENIATFAEIAVRFPNLTSVQAVADHLGIHRQTAAVWCRKERCLRPEEIVMWSRLLLVSELLEKTNRSAGALAIDLDFPSVISLRNQLKRYTGLTALEVRAAGLDAVLSRFDAAITAANVRQPETVEMAASR